MLLTNDLYQEDLASLAKLPYSWEVFSDKAILISGATGMIGSFLIDLLMYRNFHYQQRIQIYALGRTQKKAKERFEAYWERPDFHFIQHDITQPLTADLPKIDYVLHLASTTHPRDYATIPIETITSNISGTQVLLDVAAKHQATFMLASTVEVYGENRGDVDYFDEHYCGYIDSNSLRAGYPESKRAAEALCQAYSQQKGVKVLIPRLSRIYGPTMLQPDSKALSQFIKNAVAKEDIILKSQGNQHFSYAYVADAVSALIFLFLEGEDKEAYNIATSHVKLKDLAASLAQAAGVQVAFELPDAIEQAGYSKASKALLDTTKLRQKGWQPSFDLETGLAHTVQILQASKGV